MRGPSRFGIFGSLLRISGGGFLLFLGNAALGLFICLSGLGFLDVLWLVSYGMGQE